MALPKLLALFESNRFTALRERSDQARAFRERYIQRQEATMLAARQTGKPKLSEAQLENNANEKSS